MTHPNDDALVEKVRDIINSSCDTPCGDGEYCGCRIDARAAIAVLRPAIRAEALREALDALWSGPRYDRDVFDSMTKTVDGVWLREDDINCAIIALIDKEKASD